MSCKVTIFLSVYVIEGIIFIIYITMVICRLAVFASFL